MENDKGFMLRPGEFFKAFRKIELFGSKQVLAEPADGEESSGIAEDKRTSGPAFDSADDVPKGDCDLADEVPFVQFHCATARQTISLINLICHLAKQFARRIRIRIDKNEPVALSRFSAAITRASNLVNGFKYHRRSLRAGQFGRSIGRVVIANDQLPFPPAFVKGSARSSHLRERSLDQLLFVESGHHNRYFHAR